MELIAEGATLEQLANVQFKDKAELRLYYDRKLTDMELCDIECAMSDSLTDYVRQDVRIVQLKLQSMSEPLKEIPNVDGLLGWQLCGEESWWRNLLRQ